MKKVLYDVGYVDLTLGTEALWKHINARNEIRKAQKSGVVVSTVKGAGDDFLDCKVLLASLMNRRRVPYDKVFDEILQNKNNDVFLAKIGGEIISFIVVTQRSFGAEGKSEAYLTLSATDEKYASLCPNYLLLWTAIEHYAHAHVHRFNLGLLTYRDCLDPDLQSVSFYKHKWITSSETREEYVSFFKYLYLRFIKRYRLAKTLLWLARRL